LLLVSAGEGNAEHAEEVSIGGLGLNESLDECVPLLHKSAEFIAGDVHSIEVCEGIESFHFFDLELNLSPCGLVVLILQVSEADLEDTTSEGINGVFLSSGLVARGQGWLACFENAWGQHVVPLLLDEWMGELLLVTLFLEVSGVLSGSHVL